MRQYTPLSAKFCPIASAATLALLTSLLALCAGTAFGQLPPFESYTMKDGLVSNVVNGIVQDSRGFLWIATGGGVSRFDGTEFVNYTVREGLAFDFTYGILESRKHPGRLWITTGDGLSQFEGGRFKTFHRSNYSGRDIFLSAFEDSAGMLWVGTYDGVYRLEGEQFIPWHQEQFHGACFRFATAPGGLFLFASRDGLYSIDTTAGTIRRLPGKGLPATEVEDMCIDPAGRLWAVYADSTLACVQRGTVTASFKIPEGSSQTVGISPEGNLVLSLGGVGLFELPPDHPTPDNLGQLTFSPPPGTGVPVFLLCDKEENMWFINRAGGILKLSDRNTVIIPFSLNTFGLNNNLGVVDPRGRLWVADGDRLLEVWKGNGNEWKSITHATLETGEVPKLVVADQKGGLWIKGASGNLLHLLVESRGELPSTVAVNRRIDPARFLGTAKVICFYNDERDNFWISGDWGSIARFKSNSSEPDLIIDSTRGSYDTGRALFVDHDGNLWIGGNDKGLGFLSHDSLVTGHVRWYRTPDGLADNYVRSITQPSGATGAMWIGTRFSGISLFRDGRFSTLTTSDGLLSNTVWSIHASSDRQAWIGTETGGQLLGIGGVQYTITETTGKDILSIGELPSGQVWMVSKTGLILHNPVGQHKTSVAPPVYIADVQVGSEHKDVSQMLEIPYHSNELVIRYTAITFRDPEKMRYQYRIGDSRTTWSTPSPERSVTFVSVDPGLHRFEVRAILPNGVISTSPASFTFLVIAPYWQRWWFIMFAGCAVLFCIGGTVRFVELRRMRKRQEMMERQYALEAERQKTRDKIARDLHDEVSATLSGINLFAQAISSDGSSIVTERTRKYLDLIRNSTSTAQESISDIIWAINPDNDDWAGILARLRRYASDLFESKNIEYRIELPEHITGDGPGMDQRRNFWLIMKEIVTNIVRHSGCTRVSLSVKRDDDGMLLLHIEDNGRGFDPQEPRTGNGLRNIRERINVLEGTVDLQTGPDRGTIWNIRLKI